MFSNMTLNLLAAQPYDTNITAEQPWVNTKCQCLLETNFVIRCRINVEL